MQRFTSIFQINTYSKRFVSTASACRSESRCTVHFSADLDLDLSSKQKEDKKPEQIIAYNIAFKWIWPVSYLGTYQWITVVFINMLDFGSASRSASFDADPNPAKIMPILADLDPD